MKYVFITRGRVHAIYGPFDSAMKAQQRAKELGLKEGEYDVEALWT